MLGQWVGRGVAYDGPGGSAMEWTATLVVERILDGHGVREQLVVDLGEVLAGGYRSTTFYAFDPQAGHLVSFACDNRKGVSRSVATWTGATLLTATLGENLGKLAIERGTFTFEDGKGKMKVLSMVDTHEGFVMIDGTFEPFGGERRVARDASSESSRPRGELAKLTSSLGVSRLQGSIQASLTRACQWSTGSSSAGSKNALPSDRPTSTRGVPRELSVTTPCLRPRAKP